MSEHGLPILRANEHRYRSYPFLENDAGLAAVERNRSDAREHERAADSRMSGKRELVIGSEDADTASVPLRRGRKYEDGLGVVELARDRLHLSVRQSTCVRNHRERVAAVQVIRKNVSGVERVRHRTRMCDESARTANIRGRARAT